MRRCQDCGVLLVVKPQGKPKRCKRCARLVNWQKYTRERRRQKHARLVAESPAVIEARLAAAEAEVRGRFTVDAWAQRWDAEGFGQP